MSSTTSDATETHSTPHHTDLSTFQIDILTVTARLEASLMDVKGLAIKDSLEDIREEAVNHGRLYPNLDNLAESGLIEKGTIDDRSNSYRVTKAGFQLLAARRDYLSLAVDGGA